MSCPSLIFVLWISAILLAPAFAPSDPMQTEGARAFTSPDGVAWLGYDGLGRDILSRALHGGGRSLATAGASSALGMIGGIVLGILATGERWSSVFARSFIDTLLIIPGIVTALVLITLLGTGLPAVIAGVGLAQIAPVARITAAAAQSALRQEYVLAALAAGATPLYIVIVHVLRTIRSPLISYSLVVFSSCLMNTAGLIFLGLSGELGIADWGAMLYEARTAFRTAPHIGLIPGLGIMTTIFLAQWAGRAIDR